MQLTVDEISKKINKMGRKKRYIVIKNQFNVDDFDIPSLEATMNQASCLFQQPGHNDMKRRQRSEIDLPLKQQKPIGKISQQLIAIFKKVGDGKANLSGASVLQSRPGCMEQRPHRDFNLTKRPSETRMSYLVIVALQDETNFVVFTENGRQVITLNKGDVLIGRGDLIHAGGSYEIMNIRLHWYVDYPDNKRDMGVSYFYDELTDSISEGDYYVIFTTATENLAYANAANKRAKDKRKANSVRMTELNKRFKG